MDFDVTLERVMRVNGTMLDLAASDRLQVLEIAWMMAAETARCEAMASGQFDAEQDRQSTMLERIALLVKETKPDAVTQRSIKDAEISLPK
jgi:hypothetical protein